MYALENGSALGGSVINGLQLVWSRHCRVHFSAIATAEATKSSLQHTAYAYLFTYGAQGDYSCLLLNATSSMREYRIATANTISEYWPFHRWWARSFEFGWCLVSIANTPISFRLSKLGLWRSFSLGLVAALFSYRAWHIRLCSLLSWTASKCILRICPRS